MPATARDAVTPVRRHPCGMAVDALCVASDRREHLEERAMAVIDGLPSPDAHVKPPRIRLPAGRPPVMPAFHDTACRAMRLIERGAGLRRKSTSPSHCRPSRGRDAATSAAPSVVTPTSTRVRTSAVVRPAGHVSLIVITKRKELQFGAAEQRVGLERDVPPSTVMSFIINPAASSNPPCVGRKATKVAFHRCLTLSIRSPSYASLEEGPFELADETGSDPLLLHGLNRRIARRPPHPTSTAWRPIECLESRGSRFLNSAFRYLEYT